ncbi:multicopper oxidase domain-containing protein [Candidatus Nitrospira salsa]
MKFSPTRRQILNTGIALGLGSLLTRFGNAQTISHQPIQTDSMNEQNAKGEFSQYSRFHPSYGGPPNSDQFLGKLVPGFRKSGLEPVLVETPDLEKVPWKMVNGAKEFMLRCTPVKQEFLPGQFMDVWGFNGTMPGPTIEVYQGDRVRFVVHNDLPEPTSVHWHGLELPMQYDGVPGVTQDLIPPGKKHIYEFDLHQTGTFFYHSHVAMQEAFGMAGLFIIHPKIAYDPPVDRDFVLLFQNFFIPPNANRADSMAMDWNWHTINGRSGPYTTPMVCKHGERVRVRLVNFSPMQHHPVHFHGHTFWLTGTEAGRIPTSAWVPRNNTLVGVAMAQDFEFVAFNPGDWIFHCHMVHHMMNHMVRQVGPHIRGGFDFSQYADSLPARPSVDPALQEPAFQVPGYPQKMQDMHMRHDHQAMATITNRREAKGMRANWYHGVKGLMTVLRVLPEDLYHRVMLSDEDIQPGEIYKAIAKGRHQTQGRQGVGNHHTQPGP